MYVTYLIEQYKKTGVVDLSLLPEKRDENGRLTIHTRCRACRRDESPVQVISDEWVAQFIRLYAEHEATIIAKARASTLTFARLIGWFSEKEMESATYDDPDVVLTGPGLNTHKRTRSPFTLLDYTYELRGGFHIHADWYGDYGDFYGEWYISFRGGSVQEVRREQV